MTLPPREPLASAQATKTEKSPTLKGPTAQEKLGFEGHPSGWKLPGGRL